MAVAKFSQMGFEDAKGEKNAKETVMVAWLNGKKTYIGLIAAGVMGILISSGVVHWDGPTVQVIVTLIGTWTGVAINHKVEKSQTATAALAQTVSSGQQGFELRSTLEEMDGVPMPGTQLPTSDGIEPVRNVVTATNGT